METQFRQCLYLFWLFFKGMMFAFTGGNTALPTIEKGIVGTKKWLTHEEFWSYPVLSQTLPGVISIHNSILIGNRIAGPAGAVSALLGVITPPFVCMLGIAVLFQSIVDNPLIRGAIRGIRVVSVALLLGSAVNILSTVHRDWLSVVLVLAAIAVPLFFGGSAFWTIIICGLAGIISILTNSKERETNASQTQENSK